MSTIVPGSKPKPTIPVGNLEDEGTDLSEYSVQWGRRITEPQPRIAKIKASTLNLQPLLKWPHVVKLVQKSREMRAAVSIYY